MSRLLKAIIIGAAIGLITEFILRPGIQQPLEKKLDEVIK